MRAGRALRVAPVGAALLILLGGCKSWHPVSMTPEALIADERPSSIRVQDADGLTKTLQNPLVVGDSIVTGAQSSGVAFPPPRDGVLRRDVRGVEVARFNPQRTAIFVVAAVAIAISWARLAGDSSGGNAPPNEPLPKFTFSIWDGIKLLFGAR